MKLLRVHPAAFLILLSASFIVFSTVLINKYLNTNNAIVKFLIQAGDYSYSTYLIHVVVLGVALHYFGNKLDPLSEAILIIGLSAILFILSKYSYLSLERNSHLLLLMKYLLTSANKVNSLGQLKALFLRRFSFFRR